MPEPIFINFLGTGGSTPFANTNMPCVTLKYKKHLIIFDVGEGAQFALINEGLHPVRSRLTILISHFHADHTAGLPGLLHTLKVSEKKDVVYIVGPKGIHSFFKHISSAFQLRDLPFDVKILEVQNPKRGAQILEQERYVIRSFPTLHTQASIGYVFKEKEIPGTFNEERAEELGIPPSPLRRKLKEGKSIVLVHGRRIDPEEVVGPPRKGRKVVYTSDTRPTEHTISNSEGASLLIHDGAFLSEHLDQAKKKFHSTIKEAVTIAKRAKVNTLALVHFSSRYKGERNRIREEANNLSVGTLRTIVPNDGDKLTIKLEEIILHQQSIERDKY